jgi:peptide/nickel transport system permease protein
MKRIALIIPTILGVTLVMFALTYLLPGNPATVRLGGSPAAAQIKLMEQKMGLDKPVYIQYLVYMQGLISGDLGTSWVTDRPVLQDLGTRFPATLELALAGFVIMVIVGLPLGVMSATKKNGLIDHVSRVISTAGVSVPLFWLGLILLYSLYFALRLFPGPTGRLDPALDPPQFITGLYILDSLLTRNWLTLRSSVMHIILPAVALGFVNLAPVARMVRSTMLDVLASDYIRAERAAGISESQIHRDALRNAMIPILTIVGLSFGYLMAGIIVLEEVFSWPGLGLYALQSIAANDNDPMLAYVLIMTVVFISTNLVVDILYGVIDPRIRYD